MGSALVLVCLVILAHSSSSPSADDSNNAAATFTNSYIEAAIIVDKHTKADRYFVRHNHVDTFVDDFKKQGASIMGKEILFGEWPPVFTANCPSLPGTTIFMLGY